MFTYIDVQEGGVWINLGPLTYHWADAHTYLPGDELSIELSLEDVLAVVKNTGFKMLESTSVQTTFNANFRWAISSSLQKAFDGEGDIDISRIDALLDAVGEQESVMLHMKMN